jgi:hypothetical protein
LPEVIETPVPYPVYIDTGSTRCRTQPIDTMAILHDYFASVHYLDTLKDDTSAFIALEEKLNKNRITSRVLTFKNRRPTRVVNNYYQAAPIKQNIWYGGHGVATLPDKLLIMLALAMQDTRQRIWFAKADIKLRAVEVGAYLPIWRQKPKKP